MSTEVVLRERFKLNLIRRSDAVGVRYICRAVVTRSANLLGAACACLINRMGRRRVTIAVDGAFFRFSSTFPAILVETITQLIPYTYTVRHVCCFSVVSIYYFSRNSSHMTFPFASSVNGATGNCQNKRHT
ncbi:hypothetical protein AHF37_10582 [Paragonimus kellicotti]|nr:hypothetical protein AHF37_10582 [Paragonimus kellicotti]